MRTLASKTYHHRAVARGIGVAVASIVACGGYHKDIAIVDSLVHVIVRAGVVTANNAHVDDFGSHVGRPLDAVENVRHVAIATVVEHTGDNEAKVAVTAHHADDTFVVIAPGGHGTGNMHACERQRQVRVKVAKDTWFDKNSHTMIVAGVVPAVSTEGLSHASS